MINNNNIRRPQLSTARQESTFVQTPALDPEKPKQLTDEEITLKAANEGFIDLGEEEQGLTDEQIMNRAKVREAAKIIPSLVEKKRLEMQEQLEGNQEYNSRALSAANSFYQGLTEFVPAAFKTKAILESGFRNLFAEEGEELDARYLPDYQMGKAIGESLEEIFPDSPQFQEEFWAGTIAKGAGQLTGNVALALGTGGLGGVIRTGTVSGLNATLGSATYSEAREKGASEDEAFAATILDMAGVAATEAIPTARFVRRVDDLTRGSWKSVLDAGFQGSIEEGTMEAVQQFYSNLVAKNIYDETRRLSEGVAESFAAGAILGAFANASIQAALKKHNNAATPEELAEAKKSIDFISNFFEGEFKGFSWKSDDGQKLLVDVEVGKMRENPELVADDNPKEMPEGTSIAGTESVTTKGLNKFKKIWTKYIKTGGVLGKAITEMKGKKDAAIEAELQTAFFNVTKLNKAILDTYGSKKKNVSKAIADEADPVPKEVVTLVNGALRDLSKLDTLPESLQEPVKTLRQHIDYMSQEFRQRGLAQGDLDATFEANLGSYIHRSYKLFDPDVDWTEANVPADVWNAALDYASSRLLDKAKESGEGMSPERARRDAQDALNRLFVTKDPSAIANIFRTTEDRTLADKADRDVLKEREDIHPSIRQLMGEYTDPAVNYIKSINKMAHTVETWSYYKELGEVFEGSLFFKNLEDAKRVTGIEQNSEFKTNLPVGFDLPIENMYMQKDVYDAFTRTFRGEQSSWLTVWYRANAVAKYSKTVGSHVSHVRNLMGGTMFLGFNGLAFGHKESGSFKKALTVFQSYEKLTAKEMETQFLRYVRLGLTSGSVKGEEFKDILSDADMLADDFMGENFNHISATEKGAGAYKQSKGFLRKWSRKAANLYQAEDAFLRIWMFELERARLQEADPDITDEQVAELVNNIYPNYDRVNETIKGLRRVPFIAPFISFPAEVVRTSANTYKRMVEEMKSDNPKIRKIGFQRMGGMLSTTVGVLAAGAASQALMRINDEEEEAIRQFLPPWDANSTVVYLDAKGGKVRYVNTSYTNPYEFLIDPLFPLLSGDSDESVLERFGQSLSQLFEPITSEEIFFKHFKEAYVNQNDRGSEIYNPEDLLGDKLQKVFLHMWQAVEPGSISSADRFFEPLVDETSTKQASDELAGLFGLRISTVDIKRSYGFRLRDYRQSIRDARRVYNSEKYRRGADTQDINDAFQRSNNRYREIFRELDQITRAAQKTGVAWHELEVIMKESGLAQRDITALQRGTFVPFEP